MKANNGEVMSFNVYNGKNINVSCYMRQAPTILPPEFGETLKGSPKFETFYSVSDNHGASVDLVGWEAVLMPMILLMDALRREKLRAGIKKPSPEQLDHLMDVLEKLGPLTPHERW